MSKKEFIRQRDSYRAQEDERMEQIQRLRTEKNQVFQPVKKDTDNLQAVIDYYNNRRYQHRLFIQTPMQAHVSAMNRAAWYRFAQKIRRLLVETANINLILFFLSAWRSALHNSIAGFPGAYD